MSAAPAADHAAPAALALDAAQRFRFDSEGFLVLRDAVDEGLVVELTTLAASRRPQDYTQINALVRRHDAYRRAVFHPAIEEISTQCFGDDWHVLGTVLCINPPGGTAPVPGWHQDADHASYSYYRTAQPTPLFQLRFFLALSDQDDADAGGLAVLPGSHRCSLPWPYGDRQAEPDGATPVRCRRGDVMLMHQALWHRALPNRSRSARVNLQVLTGPSWIRSREAEALTAEEAVALPEERRRRLGPERF